MLKINKDIQIGDTGRTLEMLGETVAETLPIGTIAPYGGSTSQVPQNWLPCDGREVSRLEYAKLFSIIGTRFGVGDGSTTFNLPNLQGKVPVGQDVNDTSFDTLGETGGSKTHRHYNGVSAYDNKLAITNKNSDQTHSATDVYTVTGTSGFTSKGNQTVFAYSTEDSNSLQPYQVTLYIIKAFDQQLGNLRSESLPVGSEIDFDGTVSEIPEGWEATGETDDYSTNETKTSKKWIDGKPIYRKVITGNMSEGTKAHGITNIDTFTYIQGFFYNPNSGKCFPLPEPRPDYPEYAVGIYADNTNVSLERGTGSQSQTHIFAIVLEYTKTTD